MSTEQPWPASEAGPLRVLLVEDEELMRSIISQLLRAEGYDVTTAATGEDGYRLATEGRFDCVVLDLMLPGRGGLEVPAVVV